MLEKNEGVILEDNTKFGIYSPTQIMSIILQLNKNVDYGISMCTSVVGVCW